MGGKMNWDAEWGDILAIRKILGNIPGMSDRQIFACYSQVLLQRERYFSCRLGKSFLQLWGEHIRGMDRYPWDAVKRDIHYAAVAMEKGMERDSGEWKGFYLYARRRKLFRTEWGSVFLLAVGKKLAARLTEEGGKLARRKDVENRKGRYFFIHYMSAALAAIAIVLFGSWLVLTVRDDQSRYRLEEEKREIAYLDQVGQNVETEIVAIESRTQTSASIRQEPVAPVNTELEPVEPVNAEPKLKVLKKYRDFYEAHPDLYGWIRIEGTQIDYPVMRAGDGKEADFYLHHTYEGAENAGGTLFVDPECGLLPRSTNIVVYGHNMRNGEMFGGLKLYSDESFMERHKEIQFDTVYEKGRYEIIAVLLTRLLNQNEDGFRYYQVFQLGTRQEYEECEGFINQNLAYGEPVKLRKGDELLMLSTCEYSQENGRFVVVAARK